jgi:hypothetical protein
MFTCMRFFGEEVCRNQPICAPNKHLKYLHFWFPNLPRYSTFRVFRIFSGYVQIDSASSHYTNRFILRVLSICIYSFLISKYCMHSKIPLEDLCSLFRIFSDTYRFLPHILSICTDSLRIFTIYMHIHSMYWENAPKYFRTFRNRIINFFTAFNGTLHKKIFCKCAIGHKINKE